MATSITIGGQDRPFSVGTNQGDTYCRLQGISLQQYGQAFADIAQMSLGAQRDFLYSALKAGYERQGLRVDFTHLTVGDWLDAPDYDVMCLATVIESLGEQFAARAAFQKERDAKNAPAPAAEPTPQLSAETTPTPSPGSGSGTSS